MTAINEALISAITSDKKNIQLKGRFPSPDVFLDMHCTAMPGYTEDF